MKTIIKSVLCCLLAAFCLVACETPNDSVAPTIELKSVGSTEDAIIFSITANAANECYYLVYDGDAVNIEQIFSEGTKAKCDGSSVVVSNLNSNTTYYVIAAAKNSVGTTISNTISIKTSGENGGGNDDPNGGGNDDPNGGGNDDPNGGTTLPEIDGVENIVIEKTNDGRWYEQYNYYVTFIRDNGDRIILDFYTLDETMSSYLPYGQYTFDTNMYPYTLHSESSRYIPVGVADSDGYYFTDGYVSVDVANGYYAIYMMLTYDENGTSKSIQAYYNGLMSGASIPQGDNPDAKELIEVLDVSSNSFQFRINAEEGQYWRCSVVDKRVYDQTASNPGAWVVTYGFMLQGPLTFNWEHGKECEYVPGLIMEAMSSTDYLILAALMDYSGGQENNLLGGVEVVQVRTEAPAAGTGSVDVNIKQVNPNSVVFDCILDENVWCCYVAMMETDNLQEIKDGKYTLVGYNSYEECMISLVPGLSHDSMRQFLKSQYDYTWDYINYGTSYTMCIVVEDMNKGKSFIELEPFTTPK